MLGTKGEINEVDTERGECLALFKFTVHIGLVFLVVCYLLYNLINK